MRKLGVHSLQTIAIPICQMLELQVLGWELVLDCKETVILGSSLFVLCFSFPEG